MSKIRKLTSFIRTDEKVLTDEIEDKILTNILHQLESMKRSDLATEQIKGLK